MVDKKRNCRCLNEGTRVMAYGTAIVLIMYMAVCCTFNRRERITLYNNINLYGNKYSAYGELADSYEMKTIETSDSTEDYSWVKKRQAGVMCLTIAEKNGWSGEYSYNDRGVRLAMDAPNGGKYVTDYMYLGCGNSEENVASNINKYATEFDVDEYVKNWSGFRDIIHKSDDLGIPDDDALKQDAEYIQAKLTELNDACWDKVYSE